MHSIYTSGPYIAVNSLHILSITKGKQRPQNISTDIKIYFNARTVHLVGTKLWNNKIVFAISQRTIYANY